MTMPRIPARSPDPNPRPAPLRVGFRLGLSGRAGQPARPSRPDLGQRLPRVGRLVRVGAVGTAAALAAALTGCASQAVMAGPPIVLVNGYVGQSQGAAPTDAYVALRNDGPADRLISARTSAGGTVTMRGPAGHGPVFMRSYRDIPIPAHSFVRLIPNGYHLVITGARPMKAGSDITLTLVFAHAGALRMPVNVTDPQTGGSSYFLN
jgi:copper(I)-binding protein